MSKRNALKPAVAIAVCALTVHSGDSLTRLIPAGQFDASRGAMRGQGPWLLNEPGAREVAARVAGRSVDIVIDYEHQTLLADSNGKPAPAAGWVDRLSLTWNDDGLYGAVKWNAAAQEAIEADEYRYLSPVFTYNPETGEVQDLLHIALTNRPAIDTENGATIALAAARIADQHHFEEGDSVNLEQLIVLLGLATTANETEVQAEIAALKSDRTELAALREGLGVDAEGNAVEAVAALKGKAESATPDMTQFVPKRVYDETQQQLAALKANSDTSEIDRLIAEGLEDGRIAGNATAEYLRDQGLAVLKAHLCDAPAVAALKGGTQTKGRQREGDGNTALSREELAVCKNMGISPEDYQKSKAADA